MLRVIVLAGMLQACQSARAANAPSSHPKKVVANEVKDADLKALDLADQDLASRLPKNTDIKLEKPKVAKATIPKKALRRNAHPRSEPLPDEKTKSSVLWAHDREMKFSEEAAQVLEVGDKAAQAKIRAMKDAETARVAPAKVVHVSEKEADAAMKSEDDALEGSRNMEQDLKDLKEREVEQEDDQKQKNVAAKTENATKVKNAIKANVEPKSEKKTDLDHLMKLSAQMKNDASQKKIAFAQEAPATVDHRFKAMKNLADSVAKAKAGIADEPEQEIVAIPTPVANKGEMNPDKVQRLKALAGKMHDAAKGQPGTGPNVVEESEVEASTDEGELVEGEQTVAIPQQTLPASQTPQFSTKYNPQAQTVAAKSFKGSSLKDAVKQSAKDFHNKISDHVVNMHAALRDHALEMENKAKEAKIRAQMEAAAKAREAAEAEKRKEQEAQQAAIAAQKEAEDERLRQIAAKAQQENSVAARAQKAMANQASNSNSQVSESELKKRDEAHQKMLAYREQQKKERQEQQRERDLIAKDAVEAQKAAETLRALEHELPAEDAPKKKSAAVAPASLGFVILAVVLASY